MECAMSNHKGGLFSHADAVPGVPMIHFEAEMGERTLRELREKLRKTYPDPGPAMETVYISGPMTGLPDHNYPAFGALARCLRSQGYKVNCPSENLGGDQTRELPEYMVLDLQMLLDSSGIVLMPGWRDSEGAKLEARVAKVLGWRFYEAKTRDGGLADQPASWLVRPMETPDIAAAEGIEAQAKALVWGSRNDQYGPPGLDFAVVGRIWAALLTAHFQLHIDDIPATVVAVMLTGLKIGRQARTPEHEDSRRDAIGYQLCLDRIVTDDGRA
jgi:hypothetical protein